MSVNEALLSSNSRWSAATTITAVAPPGAPAITAIPTTLSSGGVASSVTVSNTGHVNLWVGDVAGNQGILLQPGAALSIGIGLGAAPYISDVVGTGTFGVVAFE